MEGSGGPKEVTSLGKTVRDVLIHSDVPTMVRDWEISRPTKSA